jgi:spoIIIJ-associated protein
MDIRTLSGENPEALEASLRRQFGGLDVFVWRGQPQDGGETVHAAPVHQVFDFVQDMAGKVCRIIDPRSSVRLKPDRDNRAELLVIIYSRDTSAFIGWHGQTLDAVELLINAIVSQHLGLRLDITVDIDQYRKKRQSFLDALVKRTVHEIERDHTERPLHGLLPKERRFVHTLLTDHLYLTTESRGRGGKRTLYITPRKDLAAGEAKDGGE